MRIRLRFGSLAAAACVTAGMFGSPVAAAATGLSHGTFHSVGAGLPAMLRSTNWAGDAVTGKNYKRVAASWVVPTVTVTRSNRYAATWVGIGGFNSGDLIQAGTAEQSVGGHAQYFAWTEVLPQPEVPITGFAVHPGDSMTVDVQNTSGKNWTITIANITTGKTAVKQLVYTSLHNSAEWIHEAPSSGVAQLRLATTTNVDFDHGTVNGATIIGSAGSLHMIQLIGPTDATPSNLESDSDGLAVADGATQPPPPPT
jgi:hypothetical protein